MRVKFKVGDRIYFQWSKTTTKYFGKVVEVEGRMIIIVSELGYVNIADKETGLDSPHRTERWSLEKSTQVAPVYHMDKETLDEIHYCKETKQ